MYQQKLALKSNICNGFKSLDIFGESVQFTFQKNTRFKTWIGSSVSCLMFLFFITFLVIRTNKLASREDPFFSMTLQFENEIIDLWKLDFMFAIESIDARVGRIKAQQVSWVFSEDEIHKNKTEIQLIDCREYLKDGGGTHSHVDLGNKRQLLEGLLLTRKNYAKFLCPSDIDSLKVEGNFGSEKFQYVKIKVEGCDLGEEECLPLEEIEGKTINFLSLRSHPSLLDKEVDHAVKYNTDQSYFKFIDS